MTARRILCASAIAMVISGQAYAQDKKASNVPDRPSASALKSLGLVQDAWNSPLRERGQSRTRPGYVRYIYNPEDVFPIRTRESMITTIKLPEVEKLTQAFSGDDAGFQVGIPSPNTIAIKALYPGVDTNLVAYTEDGRVYTFYIRSEGYNSKTISDFLVDVVNPGANVVEAGIEGTAMDPNVHIKNAPAPDEKTDVARAQRIRDPYSSSPVGTGTNDEYSDYTDFDPRTVVNDLAVYVPEKMLPGIIPYRVFRDDRFTYVDYGANASQMTEWPTVSIVIQGVESPVGFRTAGPGGRMLVIEALGEFTLRNGQRVLCIKKKGTITKKDKMLAYTTAYDSKNGISDLPPGRPGPRTTHPVTVVPVTALTRGEKVMTDTAPRGPGTPPATAVVNTPVPAVTGATRQVHRDAGVSVTPISTNAPTPVPSAAAAFHPSTDGLQPVAARPDLTQSAIRSTDVPAAVDPAKTPTPTATADVHQAASETAQVDAQAAIKPIQDSKALSGYAVELGEGDQAAMADRWKSYKVQYYAQLNGKRPEYKDGSSGDKTLRVVPISSVSEGMTLCSAIAGDGGSCSVVPNK